MEKAIEFLEKKKKEFDDLASETVRSSPWTCQTSMRNIESIEFVISLLKAGNKSGS